MSHRLFHHSILSNARVWEFLKQADATEAQVCRAARCPRCGGALHSATYPRKPHGLAADLRDDVRRFSLCRSVCRHRVKPPSVRFFGRRFYVGALFLLVSALALAGGVRLQTITRRWGGSSLDAEALAALVAGGVPPEPGVAGEAGRAGGAARRAAAALGAAHHAGRQLAFTAAAQLSLADAVERCVRARRRSSIARRKRFCPAPIGRRIIATSTKQRGGMAR